MFMITSSARSETTLRFADCIFNTLTGLRDSNLDDESFNSLSLTDMDVRMLSRIRLSNDSMRSLSASRSAVANIAAAVGVSAYLSATRSVMDLSVA